MKSNIKVVPAKSKTVRSLLRTDRKVILFCFVLVAIEFGYTKGIKILCIFFFLQITQWLWLIDADQWKTTVISGNNDLDCGQFSCFLRKLLTDQKEIPEQGTRKKDTK